MANYREELKRSVSLIPSAAALSAKDRTALVKALERLVGQHSEKSESPKMKKRIQALTKIQSQLKGLESKFSEERAALKAKQKSFQESGQNFKLYSLKNNQVLAKKITEQDEEALKDIEDIKCCRIGNTKGLKIEFIFYNNDYFENSVLTKTYHMTDDNKPLLKDPIGTKIKWYPGKILTENCHSFFNFFQPLKVADAKSRMHQDYKIFTTIWNEIAPQWQQMIKNSSNSYFFGGLLKQLFLWERGVLEGKYQKLYEPLYKKRYEIVNGKTEVQKTKKGAEAREEEKGVPHFWATAMKNDEVLAQKITKCDEEALKYLKDIKWCRINNSKGFKLDFFFDPNPYFTNTVLTKAYHISSDDQAMLEKAIGTNINWHPGKSLTPSLLKRPRKRSKNNAEFIAKQQSFFNFFDTPEYPKFSYNSATYMIHDTLEKLEEQFGVQKDLDYAIGKTIRDNIIPHAVSLFTGEVVERGTDSEDLYDDDDLKDDHYLDADADADDDEDAAVERHTKFRSYEYECCGL